MAEENHTQMMIQQQQQHQPQSQQQPTSQHQQMQQSQLQQQPQQQMQSPQLQPSPIPQQQMQQIQQPQITQQQQNQMQQQQIQQSQLQQQQLQQPQMQQQQLQAQQIQQQAPQQSATVTMSMGSAVDQQSTQMNTSSTSISMNVTPMNVVSQAQQMQTISQNANTTSGTPIQMAVQQLAPQPQTVQTGTMMSQSSGPHPTMIHPTMTVAQSPLQHVQVIQQPLSAPYLQHVYTPQQQMVFPSNLTLQHTGMGTPTLQSISGTQGLSLQLQAKPALDPKSGASAQTLQAVNTKGIVSAGTMMTASGQVIGTATQKTFQQQMMAPGKSTIIHSQTGFASSSPNQTVVIGPVGMLPNQQPIFNKAIADSQKGKTYTYQPQVLQPKTLYSSTLPVHSSAQVLNGSQLKQISSQPQIITSQSPGTMFSQAQIFGSFAQLPQGFSWPAGNFQPSLLGQNPIILRGQQSDMYIQSQPQAAMHLPVAAATSAPMPATSYAATPVAPQKHKQVRARPGPQTVAVATQTMVSSSVSVNANVPPVRTQIRPKAKIAVTPYSSPCTVSSAVQMTTTQTQTQTNQPSSQPQFQPHAPPQPKSDASNQTAPGQLKPVVPTEMRSPTAQSKSVSVGVEVKQFPSNIPVKSQAMVAPSTKIIPTTVCATIGVSMAIVSSTAVTTTVAAPVVSSAVTPKTASVAPVMTSTETSTSPTPPVENSMTPGVQVVDMEVVECAPEPVPEKPVAEVAELPPKPEVDKDVKNEQPIMSEPVVAPAKPPPPPVKEKQPQKAIVKPQVLTHVIDGFVIQEGPEPFPVSRSSLMSDPAYRVMPPEKPKRPEDFNAASPKKKLKIHSTRGRKKGARGRKPRRQSVVEDVDNSAPDGEDLSSSAEEPANENKESEDNSMASDGLSAQESSCPGKNVDDVEMKTETNLSQKLPTKWSVQEVFEFIRDLPGCSDYADTFRSQEIDGQALLLLKEDHLMTAMSMKLGPALKLISQINSIKEELSLQS